MKNSQKSMGLSPHIFLVVGGTYNPKVQPRPWVEQDSGTGSNIISFSKNEESCEAGFSLAHKVGPERDNTTVPFL